MQPYLLYYHPDPYAAGGRRMCPYTIIGFSVIRYVSLTGFRELRFYPFSTRHHTYNNKAIAPLQCPLRRRIDSHFTLLMSVEAQRPFWHRSVMALQVSLVELPLLNGFLPEAEIDNNSDQERLIDDETDDRETDDEENDDNEDVDPHAPL